MLKYLSLLNNITSVPDKDLDLNKIYYQAIKEDVIAHFQTQPGYEPYEALFYELNYYGKNFEQQHVKYHWALGYRLV